MGDTQKRLARLLAHEVEWNAAVTREYRFAFPRQYAFGFTLHAVDKTKALMEVRINDVRIAEPLLLGGGQEHFDDAIGKAAHDVVMAYIDAHPELAPDPEVAEQVIGTFGDEKLEALIVERSRTIANRSKYEDAS